MTDDKLIDEYAELARCKAGDKEAFGELYERTQKMVYATCLAILNNEDEALDVKQDTYIKAYETLDTLKDNRAFIAWIPVADPHDSEKFYSVPGGEVMIPDFAYSGECY